LVVIKHRGKYQLFEEDRQISFWKFCGPLPAVVFRRRVCADHDVSMEVYRRYIGQRIHYARYIGADILLWRYDYPNGGTDYDTDIVGDGIWRYERKISKVSP